MNISTVVRKSNVSFEDAVKDVLSLPVFESLDDEGDEYRVKLDGDEYAVLSLKNYGGRVLVKIHDMAIWGTGILFDVHQENNGGIRWVTITLQDGDGLRVFEFFTGDF